jgi:hypothetical protein
MFGAVPVRRGLRPDVWSPVSDALESVGLVDA